MSDTSGGEFFPRGSNGEAECPIGGGRGKAACPVRESLGDPESPTGFGLREAVENVAGIMLFFWLGGG